MACWSDLSASLRPQMDIDSNEDGQLTALEFAEAIADRAQVRFLKWCSHGIDALTGVVPTRAVMLVGRVALLILSTDDCYVCDPTDRHRVKFIQTIPAPIPTSTPNPNLKQNLFDPTQTIPHTNAGGGSGGARRVGARDGGPVARHLGRGPAALGGRWTGPRRSHGSGLQGRRH